MNIVAYNGRYLVYSADGSRDRFFDTLADARRYAEIARHYAALRDTVDYDDYDEDLCCELHDRWAELRRLEVERKKPHIACSACGAKTAERCYCAVWAKSLAPPPSTLPPKKTCSHCGWVHVDWTHNCVRENPLPFWWRWTQQLDQSIYDPSPKNPRWWRWTVALDRSIYDPNPTDPRWWRWTVELAAIITDRFTYDPSPVNPLWWQWAVELAAAVEKQECEWLGICGFRHLEIET